MREIGPSPTVAVIGAQLAELREGVKQRSAAVDFLEPCREGSRPWNRGSISN